MFIKLSYIFFSMRFVQIFSSSFAVASVCGACVSVHVRVRVRVGGCSRRLGDMGCPTPSSLALLS